MSDAIAFFGRFVVPSLIGAAVGYLIAIVSNQLERDKLPVTQCTYHYDFHKGLKKCPRCGYQHVYICKIGGPKRWHRYFRKCGYCRFKAQAAHTRWGANRNWNKSTTVLAVYEERGDNEWLRNRIK